MISKPSVKVNRFSRAKKQEIVPVEEIEQLKEPQPEPEPQPDISKKARGRPKKDKNPIADIVEEFKPVQELKQIEEVDDKPKVINYDDPTSNNFLADLNNEIYHYVPEDKKQKVIKPPIEAVKPKTFNTIDNMKLLEQIKQKSNFQSTSNEQLLEKIKNKSRKQTDTITEDIFSKQGSEILGKDKRILLTKIRQYKSLFPDSFKNFKIKLNATTDELQAYLDEMDSIVECDSVEQFLLDSIMQCIKILEGVSSFTRYDIQGLADLLKQNKQFHQLSKQLFIKYKVFSVIPPENQLIMLVATSAYICNQKNRRRSEFSAYLNQPANPPTVADENNQEPS